LEFVPCLTRSVEGGIEIITLGHPLLDDYLAFVAARARANTWLAVAYDLKVFFEVVGKEPAAVRRADVFAFLAAQRAPRRGETVVRLDDGEAGLAAIASRLIPRLKLVGSGLPTMLNTCGWGRGSVMYSSGLVRTAC